MLARLDEREVIRAAVTGLVVDHGASLARIWMPGKPGRSSFRTLRLEKSQALRLEGDYSEGVDFRAEKGREAMAAPWILEIAQTGTDIQSSRLYHGTRTPDAAWMRANNFRTFAGHPLEIEEGARGVLTVFARHPYTERAFAMLKVFAAQLGAALRAAGNIGDTDAPLGRKTGSKLLIPLESTLDETMRAFIEAVLAETRGRIEGEGGAARRLNMHPNTLRSRMDKLGVRRP